MQIDFDAFEFARTGNWQDPAANIRFGCQALAQSHDVLERKAHLANSALLRAAIAGCNAGPGNALRALRDGLDIDFFTANNVSNSATQLLQCHDDAPGQLIDGVNASPSREVARLDVVSAIPLALMCQLRTFLRQSLLPSFSPSLGSRLDSLHFFALTSNFVCPIRYLCDVLLCPLRISAIEQSGAGWSPDVMLTRGKDLLCSSGMIRGFNVDARGIDRGDPMTSNRRTPYLLRSMLLFVLLLSGLQCASISPYSPTAYQYATSLKVESLMLMAKAIEPYPSHQAEVEALVTKIDIAYEYAKGRPKNTISTQQWEILKDPNRHLLGGFLQRWKDASQLSQPFVTEAQGLVADAFDAIIGLESGKVASTQGQ